MASKQSALFGDRFLESYAGKGIISDHKIALIELIANSWDAAATKVSVHWPIEDGDEFCIKDNGHGMTHEQFHQRFRTLAYERTLAQGIYAQVPKDHESIIVKRPAFGRSGKGRLSGFAFGTSFEVITWREGDEVHYKVYTDETNMLAFKLVKEGKREGHGTEIFVKSAVKPTLDVEDIRVEIGLRFMTDPHFEVYINNVKVSFQNIPEDNIATIDVVLDDIGIIPITIIDVKNSDRTTQQHGIAWHVNNRLVGECTWKGSGNEYLIDGRTNAAKRYIIIVKADCLHDAVLPDWTAFNHNDEKYKAVFSAVQERIKEYLVELSKATRDVRFREIERAAKPTLKNIGVVGRDRWETIITAVQEECPSITQADMEKVGQLLAKLEEAESKYSLIAILSESSTEELDGLNDILVKWNINLAKVVLDEVEFRMRLVEKLQMRVGSNVTDEVHDLQPLFQRGLWIFGPEYETIHYTSNVGMTRVIQEIFGNSKIRGSSLRPDYVMLDDSSVGLYSIPKYDDQGGEIGVDRLTIVELKRPGVRVGDEEVNQPWKYVSELLNRGLLKAYSTVNCFILGSMLHPIQATKSTKLDGKVILQPLDYDTVLRRANSRLLNLYEKVKNAPYLETTRIHEYLREQEQIEIF